MPTKYDLAIIGSGGGAFAAAIRASTLGKSVVMICLLYTSDAADE